MTNYFNRVGFLTATTGFSASIAIGAAISPNLLTPAEAGAVDGDAPAFLIMEGDDFELHTAGLISASVTTLARGTPVVSKISGVVGTAKMDLQGGAEVRFIEDATRLNLLLPAPKGAALAMLL